MRCLGSSQTALGLFILLALGSAGCGAGSSEQTPAADATAPGGVAIVDLDVVAQRIGRDRQMQAQIEQFRAKQNEEVAAAQQVLQQKLEDFKASLGESPTPEQQQQLALVQRKLSGDFTAIARRANAALAKYKQDTIAQYRDEVRPHAREIAAARGLHVVITHQDSFQLAVYPRCDITDELATRLMPAVAASTTPASEAAHR